MVSYLRRFQKPVMIVVTGIIIITFTAFYNRHEFDKPTATVATIYGRPITYAQFQRAGRKFELCRDMQLDELLRTMAGQVMTLDEAKNNFIYNSIILEKEAEDLGINPTDDELATVIQNYPFFRTNGVYDSSKYQLFDQNFLGPRGFAYKDMEELFRDDLKLKKIKTILGATMAPSDRELRADFTFVTQKTEAAMVQLKLADFLAKVQVSEDDVKKLYEEQKATLKTDELRKVKYIALVLPPPTEKPLDPQDRAETLGKLQKQAEDISVGMADKDAKLEEVAAKYNAKVEETKDFTRSNPPAELGSSPQAAATAFKLTEAQPTGDILTTRNGYYIIQLAGITPARPLTFDEAKEKLTTQLKDDRAKEALNLKATEIRNKIDTEIKAGKSFADAAQAAGVTAEKIPAFAREDVRTHPESAEVMSIASELNEGQISPANPTSDGGSTIVYVEKRLPIDEEKYKTEKARYAERVAADQQNGLFAEWLKLRKASANVQTSFSKPQG